MIERQPVFRFRPRFLILIPIILIPLIIVVNISFSMNTYVRLTGKEAVGSITRKDAVGYSYETQSGSRSGLRRTVHGKAYDLQITHKNPATGEDERVEAECDVGFLEATQNWRHRLHLCKFRHASYSCA